MTLTKPAFNILIPFVMVLFCSCSASKRIDRLVASQYNNQLPVRDKKNEPAITIRSSAENPFSSISLTETKTSHMLPLVLYWQWDYKNTCTLNTAIPVSIFTKTMNLQFARRLLQKLDGQQLELTIEEMPKRFAYDDKAHLIFLLYAIQWDKISVQPENGNLVVSYKTLQNGQVLKTGKIEIQNHERDRGLRFFQSWKSAISEYLADYNANMTLLTRDFGNRLLEEL